MNPAQHNLLTLLRLLEGQLSPQEAAAAHAQLQDPQRSRQWELLQRIGSRAPADGTAIGNHVPNAGSGLSDGERDVRHSSSPSVSAETIAAFLEETLTAPEARIVEQQCWQSRELLGELVSTYRFLLGTQTSDSVPDSLTGRLLDICPEPGPTRRPSGIPLPALETDLETSDRPPPRVERTGRKSGPLARQPRAGNGPGGGQPARFSWTLHTSAALLGVALALTAILCVSVFELPQDSSAPVTVAQQSNQPPAARERPRPEPAAEIEPETASVTGAAELSEAQTPPPLGQSEGLPTQAAERELPAETGNVSPSALANDTSDSRPEEAVLASSGIEAVQSYAGFAIQWGQIEGLVIGRASGQRDWLGARALPAAQLAGQEGVDLASLPSSWGEAHTAFGRLVLRPDSQLRLAGTAEQPQVTLSRGSVGFTELASDRQLELNDGHRQWPVRITRDKTAIAFVVSGTQAAVLVRRGEVRMGGQRLRQGRQAVLLDHGPAASTALRADTAWFDRPQQSAGLPSNQQAKLLASNRIQADLAELRDSRQINARIVATSWSLVLFPRETISETLTARDANTRQAALRWLLSSDPADPRVRQAWRALAGRVGDRELLRSLARWTQLVQQRQRPPLAEAMRQVRRLNHDRLLIRRMAAFLLEQTYGSPVRYDPQSPPPARQRAVQQWTQAIRRIYSISPDAAAGALGTANSRADRP